MKKAIDKSKKMLYDTTVLYDIEQLVKKGADDMFTVDAMARTPVYEQIRDQLEKFILSGIMKPGEQLPSVRSLSIELSINPNTILKAYSELDNKGVITAVPGKGYFVCDNARDILWMSARRRLGELRAQIRDMALAGIEKSEIYRLTDLAYEDAGKGPENK